MNYYYTQNIDIYVAVAKSLLVSPQVRLLKVKDYNLYYYEEQ